MTYQPFGGIKGFTFGNGQTYARAYDRDGRITSYTLAGQSDLGYDNASRIMSQSGENIAVPALADRAETLTIAPSSNRLTQVSGTCTATLQYDANGSLHRRWATHVHLRRQGAPGAGHGTAQGR
ncbi:MAG: hypothetical protein U1F68_05520 [Gammaproteobacteria bacterium]